MNPQQIATHSEATETQLRLQLKGLESQVARSQVWVRRLILLAVTLALVFLIIVGFLYLSHVLAFAPLKEVSITDVASGAAQIRFVPAGEGKVEIIRWTKDKLETITEYVVGDDFSAMANNEFIWSGERSNDYTITLRYRQGLWVVSKEWSPQSTGGNQIHQ